MPPSIQALPMDAAQGGSTLEPAMEKVRQLAVPTLDNEN